MNIEWLWDRSLTLEEVKNILNDDQHNKFVEIASVLLSRKNTPKEVFDNFIDKRVFVDNWHRIKKQMRKDKWNNARIIFWQAVYEKLLQIFIAQGIKFRPSLDRQQINEFCSDVGEQIREIREEAGLTQDELAKRMSISQQIISRVENGRENISLETLERIAHALNREVIIDLSINKPDISKMDGLGPILLTDNSRIINDQRSEVFNPVKGALFPFHRLFDINGTN